MIKEGVGAGEKMQTELTPTAGNGAFYMKAGLNISRKK